MAGVSQFGTSIQGSAGKIPKQQAVELCKTLVLHTIRGSPLLGLHSEEKLKPLFQKAMQKYTEREGSGEKM
jgi:hypothetical protein